MKAKDIPVMALHFFQSDSPINYQYLRPFLFPLIFVSLFAVNWVFAAAKGGLFKREFRLRKQGLELIVAGRPVEAERLFQRALQLPQVSDEDRVRIQVCLADALFDQSRYRECREYLDGALKYGDPTGSGQGSLADLLLKQRKDPEKVIEIAEQALDLNLRTYEREFQGMPAGYRQTMTLLRQAVCWTRKAHALQSLNQPAEARQFLDRAIRITDDARAGGSPYQADAPSLATLLYGRTLKTIKQLQLADLGMKIGDAFLAMADKESAAKYFQMAKECDCKGKYRALAQKELGKLGYTS
jgi:tetratricopeptide (TPR) repeat protein